MRRGARHKSEQLEQGKEIKMVKRRKTEMKQEYEREENQATTRKKSEKERGQ